MKLNKFIILVLIVFSFSCKTDNKEFNKKTVTLEKKANLDVKSKNDTIKTKNNLTLDYLQGIWSGEKDINMSRAVRIINKNKELEIICVEGNCDGDDLQTVIELGYVGFVDDTTKINLTKKSVNNFKNKGKYMVYIDKGFEDLRFDKNYTYNSDMKLYKTTLSSRYMSDAIYYGRFNKQDTTSHFYKSKSISNKLFNFLKKQSKKDNRDYIAEFNIKGFSQKIQVIADKTYFYNDSDLKEKRKAFLVKGDVAYLENLGENEVQVYFDGKVITSGYLKLSDVKVIE